MLLSALGRPALLLVLLDSALAALLGLLVFLCHVVPGGVGSALAALLPELLLGLGPGLLVDGDSVDLLVAGCGVWPLVGDVGLALVGLGCLLLLLVALVDGRAVAVPVVASAVAAGTNLRCPGPRALVRFALLVDVM